MDHESLIPADAGGEPTPEEHPQLLPAARRRRRRWPLGALTLLLVVIVGGGVILFGGSDDAPPVTSIPTLGTVSVPTGDAAPAFIIDVIGGGRFALADELAAGHPVLLNLWASWCNPCREEMPALDAASKAHGNVSFIGVAVEDDPTAAEDFANEIGVSYPLAIDEPGTVSRLYPSPGLPTTFFITPDGRIARVLYGGLTEDKIIQTIAEVFGP
jgi:thiol-disulfide isomerase/thioredoxin